MTNINDYKQFIKFLSDFLGSDVEIILSDATSNKIVAVANPVSDTAKVGEAIRHIEQKFIKEKIYEKTDFISNYRALSTDNEKLRASTYFIKNEGGLIGLLTMNLKVESFIDLRNVLDRLVNGESKYKSKEIKDTIFESFEPSFEEMMSVTISDVIKQYDTPPDRMTVDEKMEIIEILDKRGTFLIKGSIAELAKAFKTTETTVYRYINRLSEK